jgi:hypothetical protein
MREPPRVEFLIAGAQKAGTTALFDYLNGHPDLLLPAIKEAHFFDDERQDWSAPDYRAYHAHFHPPADGRQRTWGEATPIYVYWPNCLERIAAYNLAMKLIVLLRDPVERAWSHWKMEYARGAETHPFAWCIREGRERVARGDPTAPGHHREYSYVERGFYGSQARRLLSIFPRNQLLFLRAEDLRAAPERILGTVCDFLNAPRLESVERRNSHASKEMDYGQLISNEDRIHLENIFSEEMRILKIESGIEF